MKAHEVAVGNRFWRQTSPGMRFQLLPVGLFVPRASPTRHTCLSREDVTFKRYLAIGRRIELVGGSEDPSASRAEIQMLFYF